MNTRGTLWPRASTISGWVSAAWMTSPMRVRVSSSHSDSSMNSATTIMKARVSGNLEQLAAAHRAAGASPQASSRAWPGAWIRVKAAPCSEGGGENGTAVRPQISCTTSSTT